MSLIGDLKPGMGTQIPPADVFSTSSTNTNNWTVDTGNTQKNVRTIVLKDEDLTEAACEWISKVLKDSFIPGKVTIVGSQVQVEVLFPEEKLAE